METNEKKSWSYASILTKDELIRFLSENYCIRAPSQHDFEFFKWCVTDERLEKEMEEYLNSGESEKIAKEHDKVAKAFNAESDIAKKLDLMKKLAVIDKKWEDNHKIWQNIEAARDKNTKYWEEAKKRAGREI